MIMLLNNNARANAAWLAGSRYLSARGEIVRPRRIQSFPRKRESIRDLLIYVRVADVGAGIGALLHLHTHLAQRIANDLLVGLRL